MSEFLKYCLDKNFWVTNQNNNNTESLIVGIYPKEV
jgi:hypothetical protein